MSSMECTLPIRQNIVGTTTTTTTTKTDGMKKLMAMMLLILSTSLTIHLTFFGVQSQSQSQSPPPTIIHNDVSRSISNNNDDNNKPIINNNNIHPPPPLTTTTTHEITPTDNDNPITSTPPNPHHRQLYGEYNIAWPPLTWLLSFRNSGSTYTLNLLRTITDRTTATNYGPELGDRHTLYRFSALAATGPFRADGRPFPETSVVTSTHCTDYCLWCSRPGMYASESEEFYRWCASGHKVVEVETPKKEEESAMVPQSSNPYVYSPNPLVYMPGAAVEVDALAEEKESEDETSVEDTLPSDYEVVSYDPTIVKTAIHLVENPYRNIVRRFHDAIRRHGTDGDPNNHGKVYPASLEGFKEWCTNRDDFFYMQDMILHNMDIVTSIKRVPCHSEFLLYVMWHNSAFELPVKHDLTTMVLHTEDFHHDMTTNIRRMMRFLGLPDPTNVTTTTPPNNNPTSKQPPKFNLLDVRSYFSSEERVLISSFLKVLSSSDTWVALKRYLPPPQLSHTFHTVGSVLSPDVFGEWPSVAWLMSFPNSGTFFTTQLLQIASRTATATNYAPEVGPRWVDIPNFAKGEKGPYRTSTRPLPRRFILTKTHCTGRCIECSPREYVTPVDDYVRGCAHSAQIRADGGVESGEYDFDYVKGAVHLIRNPFDNVVARFHFAYKFHKAQNDAKWEYTYDKGGFKKWCRYWDDKFVAEEEQLFDKAIFDKMRSVPCHAEFYSYVQWHNNAFHVPGRLKIPSYVIFYEDFESGTPRILAELLKFLDLPHLGRVSEFHYNGGYPDYYTDDERRMIAEFIRLVATEATFDALKRYF